jgi:hypothetical protein|tara:strand:+ start:223 stop:348 length:126 start_codon:yes stop_codon:yes gene_type:complete
MLHHALEFADAQILVHHLTLLALYLSLHGFRDGCRVDVEFV